MSRGKCAPRRDARTSPPWVGMLIAQAAARTADAARVSTCDHDAGEARVLGRVYRCWVLRCGRCRAELDRFWTSPAFGEDRDAPAWLPACVMFAAAEP